MNYNHANNNVLVIGLLIGHILGLVIIYIVQWEFRFDVFAGGIVGVILFMLLQFIKFLLSKKDLPEVDERIFNNLLKVHTYGANIYILILVIGLTIFSFLEHEAIPIQYLWISLFIYIWVISIITFIVKRK